MIKLLKRYEVFMHISLKIVLAVAKSDLKTFEIAQICFLFRTFDESLG